MLDGGTFGCRAGQSAGEAMLVRVTMPRVSTAHEMRGGGVG